MGMFYRYLKKSLKRVFKWHSNSKPSTLIHGHKLKKKRRSTHNEYWSTHNEYWSTQSPFKCSLCEYCTVPKMQKWAKSNLNICK